MLKPVANCEHCDAKKFEHEPPRFCCRGRKVELNELNVPNELMRLWSSKDYITSRAILSTRNDGVDMINMKMIGRFYGNEMVYHSFDCAVDDPHNYYPEEFLNTLTPNDLPPHVLKLKIGCPVILLRNIAPANGLCNGTRLIIP
jgi:hypothetical protein